MAGKIQENKQHKMDQLIQAASTLFTEKGMDLVSVSEIARKAGVAKGTFYLYFKDKEHLRDHILSRESLKLFQRADARLRLHPQPDFNTSIIYLIEQVLLQLQASASLVHFIRHSLSYALLHTSLQEIMDSDKFDLSKRFVELAAQFGLQLEEPDKTLFMIVELAGGTCYSCLVEERPDTLEATKPVLFKAIEAILDAAKKASE